MDSKRKFYIILFFILSIFISFVLGRVSVLISKTENNNNIHIITSQQIKKDSGELDIEIRASSRGSKYYYPWCQSTFNEENTIYFKTSKEAEDAGYSKADSCLESN